MKWKMNCFHRKNSFNLILGDFQQSWQLTAKSNVRRWKKTFTSTIFFVSMSVIAETKSTLRWTNKYDIFYSAAATICSFYLNAKVYTEGFRSLPFQLFSKSIFSFHFITCIRIFILETSFWKKIVRTTPQWFLMTIWPGLKLTLNGIAYCSVPNLFWHIWHSRICNFGKIYSELLWIALDCSGLLRIALDCSELLWIILDFSRLLDCSDFQAIWIVFIVNKSKYGWYHCCICICMNSGREVIRFAKFKEKSLFARSAEKLGRVAVALLPTREKPSDIFEVRWKKHAKKHAL